MRRLELVRTIPRSTLHGRCGKNRTIFKSITLEPEVSLVFRFSYYGQNMAKWLPFRCHRFTAEINNSTTDIYEIKEDKSTNTITFVNPKTDQRTLREIVYYHLIEKPYGQNAEPEQEIEEGPDFDETIRPFTNSHGLPFLEAVEEEQDSPSETVEELENKDEEEEYIPNKSEESAQEDSSGSDPEVVYEYYYEEIDGEDTEKTQGDKEIVDANAAPDVSTEIPVNINDNITTQLITNKPEEFAEEVGKETTDNIKEEIKKEALTSVPQEDTTMKEEVTNQELLTSTPAIQEVLENKAKRVRNRLFERIKERYYSKNNQTENNTSSLAPARRKREINISDVPEAPKLGQLNYDALPSYLRAMISTEKPPPKSRNYDSSSEEDNLQEIRHKMERMMAKLRSDGGSDESRERPDPPAPRTYGMNLTEDHGYVWNDMWTKPGVHFDVDASESKENIKKPDPEEKEIPVEVNDSKSEESKEIAEDKNEFDEQTTEHDDKKSEEIDEHNKVTSKEDNDSDIVYKPEHNNHNESENGKKVDDKHGDREKSEDKSDEDEVDTADKGRKRHNDKKETTMDELLENEQFWKWLTDWTTVYMDVLTELIKDAVQEEVSSQIKPYFEDHKDKDKTSLEDEAETDKKKPEKDNDGTDSQTENGVKSNHRSDSESTKDKIKDEKKESDNTKSKTDENISEEELLRRRKDKEDKNKKDSENIEKDASKNDAKDNKTELSKKKKPEHTTITSQNIYGNSVGSDQVTNIFIFYPNSDASKLINDIKDGKDSKVNVFVPEASNVTLDERIYVPDEDKDKKSTTSAKENDKKDKIDLNHENDKTSTDEKNKENEKKELITKAPVDEEQIEPSKDLTTNSTKDNSSASTEIPNITKQPAESVSTDKTEIAPSTESNKVDISTESNADATKSESENENTVSAKDETKVEKENDEIKDNIIEQNETSTQKEIRDESEISTAETIVSDSKNSEEKISDPII